MTNGASRRPGVPSRHTMAKIAAFAGVVKSAVSRVLAAGNRVFKG